MKRLGIVLALGAAAGAGCAKLEEGKTKIALVMKARTNPFFDRMEKGAKEEAAKRGVDLQVYTIADERNFEEQAQKIENAAQQGIEALLIAPADSKAVVTPLLAVREKGIKIINLDNRIDAGAAKQAGLTIDAFVGPDNVAGAAKSAEHLFQLIGSEGKVAMLEGIVSADNARQRKEGFEKALKEHPKLTCVASIEAKWETDVAFEKMQGILDNHADLAGVFCANDNMAIGAIRAIEGAGKAGKIKVTAYDNIDAARQAMKEGKLHGTIEQHPDEMGRKGVEAALTLIADESVPKEIPVPTDLVTPDDVK
ncbi:MAG: substrate-binding domain-containing protein [Planctomycetes bacterium]|nr:substrate-binding domain-containing protein [Planctomycetota bacterium]